jgi:NAD(P)-dependent dehydrogenase (short-subunit alcohol dehydrogenase family)
MQIEQFRRTIDVNLIGTFLFVKYFLQSIDSGKQPPAVVIIGSTAGRFGEALHADCNVFMSFMIDCRCGQQECLAWRLSIVSKK